MNKVSIITGGTSGIGAACARLFSASGYSVYTISRRKKELPGCISLSADVTDFSAVKDTLSTIYAREKRIDVIVNCAGFGISGALEFTDPTDARRQIEVNLFGIDNVCKAVIPYMRKQGSGRIINISSVAAIAAIPFQGWYSVSKAAINTYTLALANELRNFGISICAVMPGDIQTGFTDARRKSIVGDEVYDGRIERSVAHMERDERNGMPPEAVARKVLHLANVKHPKPLCSVGLSYQAICMLIKFLPAQLVNRIIYILYCK